MVWTAKPIKHRSESRIAVYFKKMDLIARIKQQEGARWSLSLGAWHMPDTSDNKIIFKIEEESTKLPSIEGKDTNRKI